MRLPLLLLPLLAGASLAATPETFTIKTLPAQMRYDVAELTMAPGAEVKIVFENPDDMPHNLVFFQPGTDVVAVCNKQLEKPEEALKRNWLPEDPRMWMHSKVLNPKEREELVFKAPAKPGIYPYVCTMPGHALIMQGKLKVFPSGPPLTGLKFKLYLGDWQKLPDFDSLPPHREGPIEDNLVQLKLDDYKNQFGVVYTGKVKAPTTGDYFFLLACDDGARVLVDGKKVVEHDRIGPATDILEKKVRLTAGEHDLRVEYFQAQGGADLFVGWRGPEFTVTPLSKWVHPNMKAGATKKKKEEFTGIPLPVTKEPVVYRNFIDGAGTRGIGVGYPGGFNLAWNAETMSLALVWRGAFIDAARHWNGRGGGFQPPLGFDTFKPSGEQMPAFAVLPSPVATWPQVAKGERPEGYRWRGYELDAKRVPTFFYEWNGVQVSERYETAGEAMEAEGKLVRIVRLNGKLPENAMFLAATGAVVQPRDGAFEVEAGGRFIVRAEGAKLAGTLVLVPARQEIKVSYAWPMAHAHTAQSSNP